MRTASSETLDAMARSLDIFKHRLLGEDACDLGHSDRIHVISLFCKRNGLVSYLNQLSEPDPIDVTTLNELLKLSSLHDALMRLHDEIEQLEGRIVERCGTLLKQWSGHDFSGESADVEMDQSGTGTGIDAFGSCNDGLEDSAWMFADEVRSTASMMQTSKRKRGSGIDSDEDETSVSDAMRSAVVRQRMQAMRPDC